MPQNRASPDISAPVSSRHLQFPEHYTLQLTYILLVGVSHTCSIPVMSLSWEHFKNKISHIMIIVSVFIPLKTTIRFTLEEIN